MPRKYTPPAPRCCEQCGQAFTPKRNRHDQAPQRFCSRACRGASQRRTVTAVCASCGVDFVPVTSERARGGGLYCGTACYHTAQRTTIELTCAHCERVFTRTPSTVGRFCSHTCYNLSRKVALVCPRCGETFYRKASQTGTARYCSRACKERETPAETAARFWSQVDKSGECWLWKGSVIHSGYGRFTADGKQTSAHRWSYQHAYGPLAEGLLACHSCDTPRCVNPAHLFPGTHATNTDDMVRKERNVRGSLCHTAKLRVADVHAIRGAYARGERTQRQLATHYGV